jgi:hypothetical protein
MRRVIDVRSIDDLMPLVRINVNGCWEYVGLKTDGGKSYPAFRINGVVQPGHRGVWELVNGKMPSGRLACHKCANPRCVRPDAEHVYAGTPTENIRDMVDEIRSGNQANHWEINRRRMALIKNFRKTGVIA